MESSPIMSNECPKNNVSEVVDKIIWYQRGTAGNRRYQTNLTKAVKLHILIIFSIYTAILHSNKYIHEPIYGLPDFPCPLLLSALIKKSYV
jgi:hypothetical protein